MPLAYPRQLEQVLPELDNLVYVLPFKNTGHQGQRTPVRCQQEV